MKEATSLFVSQAAANEAVMRVTDGPRSERTLTQPETIRLSRTLTTLMPDARRRLPEVESLAKEFAALIPRDAIVDAPSPLLNGDCRSELDGIAVLSRFDISTRELRLQAEVRPA